MSPILQRQVPIRHAIGTSAERRSDARLVGICFAVALAALIACWISSRIPNGVGGGSSPRFEVQAYAFEAFPAWAAAHPWLQCPQSIDDLSPYTTAHLVDVWGMKLAMECTSPSQLVVRSAGPDTRFDTPDDITSHDP